jgi:hypothetical protein
VVFPVRCISSVSPRFCFRRHTFCFLPLPAILEPKHYVLNQQYRDGNRFLTPTLCSVPELLFSVKKKILVHYCFLRRKLK